MNITLTPVAWVRSTRKTPEDDNWDKIEASIELDDERFSASAFEGLESFSHIEVVFYLHEVDPEKIEFNARHPRNNHNWPRVGVFVQRGKDRPNPLGVTVCQILGVEGTRVRVKGLDAIDGTPVLDLKPWYREFAPRGEVVQPSWVEELMAKYW